MKQQGSGLRGWSLMSWNPTQTRRNKRTSGPRGARISQSASRLAVLRVKTRIKHRTFFRQFASAPAPAAAPEAGAAQLPLLTPAATPEERAASLAPLSRADVSGGRAASVTVVSVTKGLGPPSLEAREFPVVQLLAVEARTMFSTKTGKSPASFTRGMEANEATPLPVLDEREAARLE